jgi:cytochrome b subunit of formate dehydrogenase
VSRPTAGPGALIRDDEVFERMSRAGRWRHMALFASFVVLALTGFPLLAREIGLVRLVFGRGGGPAWRGVVHRAAAVVFIVDIAWYLLPLFLTARGRRERRARSLGVRDLKDAAAFFVPRSRRPEFGRYGFAEKLDFWSVLGGSAAMIVTGLLMWFPDLSLRLFPLRIHRVFAVIHGYEAVLAVVAVFIGHMYAAHFRPGVFPMSRVWLDGKITGAGLRRFHPLEYRDILEERNRGGASAATAAPEKSIIKGE